MQIASSDLIAIVGAGTMGAGIAQVAATAGHAVVVIDAQPAALDWGRASVAASIAALVQRGRLEAEAGAAIENRIRWSTELSDASAAVLAIEAIVEDLDAKLALFTALAAQGGTPILASNTSSLSIDALAAASPGRVVGLHFFNPVPAMKLVEVVAAHDTPDGVIDALSDLMRRWSKHPVAVRDVPGFIVNRVARPYYAEGFAALGEGIVAEAIDDALTGAGGFRMGPLALTDLIGQDVNYAVARSIFEAYDGKTRFRPQAAQQALVEQGLLGRKTGSGVYSYATPAPVEPAPAPAPPPALLSPLAVGANSVRLAPLVALLRARSFDVQEAPGLAPEMLRAGEIILALGDGRSLAARTEVDILLDHARDFETTPALVASARGSEGAAMAIALAHALDKRIILLADRPGQLVLRTLCQLANAAADAVTDDVASDAGIDEALRFGANHPEGPLGWARRTGPSFVASALDHIAQETGDDRYLPSAGLQRL